MSRLKWAPTDVISSKEEMFRPAPILPPFGPPPGIGRIPLWPVMHIRWFRIDAEAASVFFRTRRHGKGSKKMCRNVDSSKYLVQVSGRLCGIAPCQAQKSKHAQTPQAQDMASIAG
eukprot:2176676-Rhodomonas_salina.3